MGDGRKPAVLTGLAVGDALGMPFEHFSDHVDARLDNWSGEYQPGAWPGRMTQVLDERDRVPMPSLQAGWWTDDTSMALALSQTLVSLGRYDPATAGRAYVLWALGEPLGMGGSTRDALRRLRDGTAWNECGQTFKTPEEVGNGTAMRVAPLGFFYRADLASLRAHTDADARITHAHIEGGAASFVVATLTAALANADPGEVTVVHLVEDLLDTVDAGLASTLVVRRVVQALSMFNARTPTPRAIELLGRRGNAAQTVATAVYCAMAHADDFAEGVRQAVRGGGDADTRGAITGALLGARLGRDAIPTALLDGLKAAPMLMRMDDLLAKGPTS